MRRERWRKLNPEREREQRLASVRRWQRSPKGKAWVKRYRANPAVREARRAYNKSYYAKIKADPVRWTKRTITDWRARNKEHYKAWHQRWRHQDPKGIKYRIRNNLELPSDAPESFVRSIRLLGALRKEIRDHEYR